MAPAFRALAERMDRLLVDRLGDQATLEDGTMMRGAFASPFLGAQIGAKASGFRLGAAVNADQLAEPTFHVRAVDAIKLPRGAFVTVDLAVEHGGGRYKVVRHEPDGSGMVNLVLGADNERDDDIQ
ncbi:hypothetical protein PS862_02856 [Pseudomonas fluorescens]|uniref:Uncharacterized protein n=1 Tax=Pseudomonas fluorescens TaxID=294 RepID=A0A5E7KZP4_PSEFL|nr:hypothetical protein [Pseudomonas fluorescens]VVP01204.1 hypothetical protein PS862_02856 [Pseudomonas fluorescens]